MDVREAHIITPKHMRYAVLEPGQDQVDEIWYVLHGYGQLARYFIRKFESAAAANRLIVAPEGMHRFYVQGHSGRVGASWMTKEDRQNDIQDYVQYLDALHASLKSRLKSDGKVKVIGFSQGAATACRWAVLGNVSFDALALWAGVFPPDLPIAQVIPSMPLYFLVGNQDEFLNEDEINIHLQEMHNKQLAVRVLRFDGKHDIYPEPLQQLMNLW
jgi:predicted esterase